MLSKSIKIMLVFGFFTCNIFAQELPRSLFPNQDIYDLDLLLEKSANFEEILDFNPAESTNFWSLADVIDMALVNNLELAKTKKDLDAAQALYTGSIQDFYVPKLSVGISATTRDLFTTSKDPLVQAETSQGFLIDLVVPSITLSKTIFNGFSDLYSYRIAKENYLNAQNTYTNKMRDIVYQTTLYYYNQFLKQEEIKVSLERLRQLKDQLNNAQVNYQNGRVSDYDVTLSKSQFFAAQPVFFAAEKNRLISREEFYKYIGYVNNRHVRVELQGELLEVTNIQFSEFDQDASLSFILSNDTTLATLRAQYANAKSTKGKNNSIRMPKLNVQFDYVPSFGRDVAIGNFGEAAYNGAYSVGASLQVPILEWIPGTGVASTVKASEQDIIKAQFALVDAEEQKIIEMKNNLLCIRELGQSVAALRISEEQAGLAAQIARVRYQNGRISLLELNQAQVDYIDTKKQLLNAVFNELQAKLFLQQSINTLPAFLEEVSKLHDKKD